MQNTTHTRACTHTDTHHMHAQRSRLTPHAHACTHTETHTPYACTTPQVHPVHEYMHTCAHTQRHTCTDTPQAQVHRPSRFAPHMYLHSPSSLPSMHRPLSAQTGWTKNKLALWGCPAQGPQSIKPREGDAGPLSQHYFFPFLSFPFPSFLSALSCAALSRFLPNGVFMYQSCQEGTKKQVRSVQS